jgi:CDP-glucose 4,6-dehydratase
MENVVMEELLHQTYKGKKVFLTGHTGFKGAWMLLILRHLGAEVKGYALEPEDEQNLYSLLDGDSLCKSVIADIRERERLKKELVSFDPDYVFHLAAQSLVRRSFSSPAETYEINVIGTTYVVDALRELKNDKPRQVVVITTDKVYENREQWEAYKESDPLGGFDPYSSSKACAEIAASSYRQSFFHPSKYPQHQIAIATARAGNVIGGGDWAEDRIIPDMVRALTSGQTLKVRNPDSVRPWQHVLEPVSGYLVLGAKLAQEPQRFAEAYNFGPYAEDNLTVKELVKKSLSIWGSGKYEAAIDPNAPHEAKLLRLDISKAINELNWKPRWDSSKALEMTVNWYKTFSQNPRAVTLEQIKTYFD